MSAITGDYVAGFLGSAEGRNWNMDPFDVSGDCPAVRCLQPVDFLSIGYQDQGQCRLKRSG